MAMTNQEALVTLAEIEGMTQMELFEESTFSGVAKGICPECGYTTEVEPDCKDGYCEGCDKQTVQSCLVLADMI